MSFPNPRGVLNTADKRSRQAPPCGSQSSFCEDSQVDGTWNVRTTLWATHKIAYYFDLRQSSLQQIRRYAKMISHAEFSVSQGSQS